ncbi:hypothetical protein EON64_02580, partial [archaeon]
MQDKNASTPTSSASISSTGEFDVAGANAGWDFVGCFSGVDTYVRRSDSSSPLLSFRGVAVLDVHISECLGPFVNVTHSLEWISMLKSIEQWPHPSSPDPHIDIIYQVCSCWHVYVFLAISPDPPYLPFPPPCLGAKSALAASCAGHLAGETVLLPAVEGAGSDLVPQHHPPTAARTSAPHPRTLAAHHVEVHGG